MKIPDKILVGGHTYEVVVGNDRGLESEGLRGSHSGFLRKIELRSEMSDEELSCTFIHEILHAINEVYINSVLIEREVDGLANGFHQVLEQLGVRFTK